MSAPGVRIGANVLIRLEGAIHIMKCYEMVNHRHSKSHLRYCPVIKNFKIDNAIKEQKKKEVTTLQTSQKLDYVL